jgi:phosphomannomutase
MMATIRSRPPAELLDEAVTAVEDRLPESDVLILRAGTTRVVVRPSGTEPKLKAYLEVVIPVHPDDGDIGVDAARIAAAGRLDAIKGDVKAALGI